MYFILARSRQFTVSLLADLVPTRLNTTPIDPIAQPSYYPTPVNASRSKTVLRVPPSSNSYVVHRFSMYVAGPGLRLLTKGAIYCTIPIVGSTIVQYVINETYNVYIPTWTVIVGSFSFIPLATCLRIMWKRWKDQRDAATMGAQVVPKLNGGFGNLGVIGTLTIARKSGYPGDYLVSMLDSVGPVFDLYMMYSDYYFTASPEYVKLMLATDFTNFVKGEKFQEAMGAVLGTGVFNSDGDMWKFHRSITRPFFTRDRIRDYELLHRHSKVAVSQLKQRLRKGYAVDFQDLMSRFTLDTASEFLFGSCVDSLSAGLPYPYNVTQPSYADVSDADLNHSRSANAFANAFLEAQAAIAEREFLGWIWPLYQIWEDKTRKPMQIVDGYIEPIIREALAKKKAGLFEKKTSEHPEDGETLLDHLVQVTEDPKLLKDETLNIMIAGRDTTASTLTFVVYLLSMYPHIMARLRQEILDEVGLTKTPDANDIKEMKYLRAVINETLRLYPAVPFNVRQSVNATTWPHPDPTQKPFYLPAKTKCCYSVFLMHRRTDLWGPDALEFDPDRFLDDRVNDYLVKNPFIFLPFNAGPRICLGQQFAYHEISFMLIRLLQSFSSITLSTESTRPDLLPPAEWKESGGRKAGEKFMPKNHLTLYFNGGMWVKMEEAVGGSN
ncbi:hypothetical protein APHAL10511_005785 [Amanita phalloides]|nr:hypothetical protein APHAL10511_005785 [Amanita phalloides]